MADEAMILIGQAAKLRTEEFKQALSVESERGVFLVGGAYLEEELKVLLLAHVAFEKSLKVADSASDNYKPLESMHGRCNQAFTKGLIFKWEHDNLHLIREIRNDFSHEIRAMSFNSASVSPKIQKLMGRRGATRERVIEMVTRLGGLLITRVLILSAEGLSVKMKKYFLKELFSEDPFQYT